jgi:2,4-dienoyl-CoA reductase-like NADH-dependent reductase (Old Yellow Enzyme family)
MRGKVPLRGMIRNGTSLAEKITMALFGPLVIRKYRFKENFFLKQAREIRETVTMPLVYLGGVDSKKGIMDILDAGFDFIAIARALIHDPEFIIKLRENRIESSECTRCNQCIVEMDRDGVRCVL